MPAVKHPAKFSAPIVRELRYLVDMESIRAERSLRLLDPFAGVGGIHELASKRVKTVGIELEPEWAEQHPNTRVGNALALPFRRNSFDVVCTSPCYGNRMADNHDARERCRLCGGSGRVETPHSFTKECEKCGGTGHRNHERNTYKHTLGRDLSPGSAAGLQWGPEYWTFHRRAWEEAWRVLRPSGLFILNIKDHIRNRQVIPASEWHVGVLALLGLQLKRHVMVPVDGLRQGENHEARVPYENIFVFRHTDGGLLPEASGVSCVPPGQSAPQQGE